MKTNQRTIREGMTVYSADGERLGKVAECGSESFRIEKGLFFQKDYYAGYDSVTAVSDDAATLSLYREELSRSPEGILPSETAATGHRTAAATSREEARVPVAEEHLRAEKVERAAGEVRVRKEVHTGEEEVRVPVKREEVVVERLPAGEARAKDAAFEESELRIPLKEEHVTVHKEPVVKEEVRVSKRQHEEEEVRREPVRRESVRVEGDRQAERFAAKER